MGTTQVAEQIKKRELKMFDNLVRINAEKVSLGGLEVTYSPRNPRFAG